MDYVKVTTSYTNQDIYELIIIKFTVRASAFLLSQLINVNK